MHSLTRPTPAPAPWADPYTTAGVTGTNGKTSTTLLLASALRAAGHSVLVETTLGYSLDDEPLDVPRTVGGFLTALEAAARRGARHAAIETTSEALARGTAKLWRFDVGVFTNLSHDHLAQHGSFEHYLASKAQLFMHLGPGQTAVLNACDPSSALIDRATPPDVRRQWYAVPSRGNALVPPDLSACGVRVHEGGTTLELAGSRVAEALGGRLEVPLVGEVFAENALAAALGALACGAPPDRVRAGLAGAPKIPGRFEIVATTPLVAVDYAHTPDALRRTAVTARTLAGDRAGRVVFVFGAGGGRDRSKREAMGRAVGELADWAIVTSDNPRHEDPLEIARAVESGCRRGGRAHVRVTLDRRDAIRDALSRARPEDVVVIAGKGHERGQIVGDEVVPFSDVDVARELLAG